MWEPAYPAITLTVNVAPAAPPSLTNTATVSGGGEINTANSTAQDITTIGPGPDLTITKSHTGNFTQGQAGTYTLTVSNVGGSPTSGSVSVIDTLPGALVPAAAGGTGWTCQISGQGVNCARSDPLAPGQSYPAITLTVSVQRNAPASVTNTAVVFGGGEVNPSNNTAPDPTTITAGPNLTITKSHTGNFTQGQTGTYTLTVSNTGGSPTSGTIVVTDSLPSGLSSTGATGARLVVHARRPECHLFAQRHSERRRQLSADYTHGGGRGQCPCIGHQHGDGCRRGRC